MPLLVHEKDLQVSRLDWELDVRMVVALVVVSAHNLGKESDLCLVLTSVVQLA